MRLEAGWALKVIAESQVGLEAWLMPGHVVEIRETEQRGSILAGGSNLVGSIRITSDAVGAGESAKSDGGRRVEWRAGVREVTSDRVLWCGARRVRVTRCEGARSRAKGGATGSRLRGDGHLSSTEAFTEIDNRVTRKSASGRRHGSGLLETIRLVDPLRVSK